MEGQDWNPLTINGRAKAVEAKAVIAAKNNYAPEAAHARKVAEAEYVKPKKLAAESRQELVNKRVEMKKSQAELNQLCSFPVNTIKEIEAGRITPTINQLNTLNRILKTGLKLV